MRLILMGSDVSGSVGMESDGFGWILLCIKVKLDPNRSTRILMDLDGFIFLMFSMKDMCFIKSIIFVLMSSISIETKGSTKWVQTSLDRSKWISMGPDGSCWVQMDPAGSGLILIGSDESWWVQIYSDGYINWVGSWWVWMYSVYSGCILK